MGPRNLLLKVSSHFQHSRLRNQKGLTLIEIMIVLIIVGGLMATLGSTVMSNFRKAKIKQARLQMGEVAKALEIYSGDCKQYPTSDEGLAALTEAPASCKSWGPDPYLKKNVLKDPWNNEFVYELNGSSFALKSLGKDKKEGGSGEDADITYNTEE
ncbi:MAG: type II secretion system major pseudopilin GspG [Bdellovibrionales bacterium]|nr:type II secretion system major pseudopilin GspG [Bdellovibrionales bacterium]